MNTSTFVDTHLKGKINDGSELSRWLVYKFLLSVVRLSLISEDDEMDVWVSLRDEGLK